MPKLKALNSKKVTATLKKSGFVLDHVTGSHYILYNSINQKRVTVPYRAKDLPKGTLMSIIRSSGLLKEDFV